ncbi:hypothetical protein AOQ73_36515 [Bradyrhizobium pachyrhizi]|uniref:hypothetical protein n=1 Tax=Bradyrhizobium pachyrhizi TaxID=280333 RepID=UPI000704DC34|nr:hypothetical protein [Bradyrhizobium pachyrhizi]KRP85981.1 hypothetical protein AOQ73_36515 [Bradyrhizobium pachyrhizi]
MPPIKARGDFGARALADREGARIAEADLLQSGGAYDLDQVRSVMGGISRHAVNKRVEDGTLLAIPGLGKRKLYPVLQFNPDGTTVDGLKAVTGALPTSNPWVLLNFLIHPDDRLGGRRPIDLLRKGEIKLVIEAARRTAEHGA